MNGNENRYLGEEPVGSLMRKYAIPCIISLLVGALYNIVDQIFIANASYLGSYGNAANTVVFPLTVRRVKQGDWMVPYGMKGRKLLSDLMTDCKMNLFEKRRQLVVVDARGAVVWTVGLRTDARVAVSDATQEVLEMELCDF